MVIVTSLDARSVSVSITRKRLGPVPAGLHVGRERAAAHGGGHREVDPGVAGAGGALHLQHGALAGRVRAGQVDAAHRPDLVCPGLERDAGVLAGRDEHRPGRLAGGAQGRRRGGRLGRRRLLRLGQVHALPRRGVGRRGLRAEAQDPRRDQGAAAGEEADRQSDAHQGDQSGDDRVLLPLGLRHGAGASSRLGSTAGSGPLPLSPRHPEARNRTPARRPSTGRTTAGFGGLPIGAPCLA